jgi:uncharacterized protein (DUF1501 family)
MDRDHLKAHRELWQPAGGPNGMSRRRFLQALGVGTGAALAAPSLISRLEAFGADSAAGDGILVLVMLDGGNDGLNTLVPFNDAKYRSLRPTLRIDPPNSGTNGALGINDPNFGLHPLLPKLRNRYLANQVAFVRGVGYNPPDMSHFTSMGYWMQGWKDAPPTSYANGWVGRYLDTLPGASTEALLGVCIGATVPLHMIGGEARGAGIPLSISGAFGINRSKPHDARMFDAFAAFGNQSTGKGQWADLYGETARNTINVASRVQPAYASALPSGNLVQQLALTARLINLNLGTRVFHTQLGTFDTHGDQKSMHNGLLTELDNAIETFFTTLSPTQRPRVTLLTFSEFGRRPFENANGTDHGAAGLDIVIGEKVKGGLYGAQPSLTDLDQDDNLKANVDFRAVYAEVLASWLGADPVPVLGKDWPRLGLFSGAPASTPTTASTASSTTTTSTTSTTSTTTTSTTKPATSPTASSTTSTTSTTQPSGTTTPTTPTTKERGRRLRRNRSWREARSERLASREG